METPTLVQQEKDKLDAKREGFVAGFMNRHIGALCGGERTEVMTYATRLAVQMFPDPKPPLRWVKTSDGGVYRVLDGILQFRLSIDTDHPSAWSRSDFTAQDIRNLHDLLENPNE